MRPGKTLSTLLLSLSMLCAAAVYAQSDVYNQINPLESAVKSNTATHDQQIQLSRLYIQAGRYYEASQISARLLAIDPNDADAIAIRDDASTHLRQAASQRVTDAEAAAQRSDASDQDRLTLANAYFDAGRYDAALDTYSKLPASMQDRDVRLRQARAMAWSGRFDSAERAYSALLKDQSTPELQLEYGRLLTWMGASKPAVAHLRTLDQQLGNEDTAIALANAEAASGNREEAIQLLTNFTNNHSDAIQAKALLRNMQASPELRIEHVTAVQPRPAPGARADEPRALALQRSLNDVQFIREHSRKKVEGRAAIEKAAPRSRRSSRS
jgi:thioredoxin-like negative regulator of GroEL